MSSGWDGFSESRCLLILDNVDQPQLLDPTQVARLNAGDWLHVLATTRLAEAAPLMRPVLAIWEKTLSHSDPNVTALNNLAQLLQATNRIAEAEPPDDGGWMR